MLYRSIHNLCKWDLILKTESTIYWNIRELQPEDGLRRKAGTCSCHYFLYIIYTYYKIKFLNCQITHIVNTEKHNGMPHLKITNYYNAYNALLEIFGNKYYLFVYVKF